MRALQQNSNVDMWFSLFGPERRVYIGLLTLFVRSLSVSWLFQSQHLVYFVVFIVVKKHIGLVVFLKRFSCLQ